jgi:LmbE family N-acetylglucosaminyl deacetylase
MARLYVSAHQDDDLIFMSPCLMEDIASGAGVWTVYVTAGDAGFGEVYWRRREEGERAAYSAMGASGWRGETLRLAGRDVTLSISADDRVRLVFLRLPDGGRLSKEEEPSKALERIWNGEKVEAVDHSNTYTRRGLITTLTEIIRLAGADVVSTHDPENWVAGCDHIDHIYTGLFVGKAAVSAGVPLILFKGYNCDLKPPNLPDVTYHRKRAVFEEYVRHDPMVPSPLDALYESWLRRSIGRLVPPT